MGRGQREMECLRAARNFLLEPGCGDDNEVINRFTLEARQHCLHGMSNSDLAMFLSVLSNCHENIKPSEFPDFVADDVGFIEHFQVTGGTCNRKGAVVQRALSDIEKDADIKASACFVGVGKSTCLLSSGSHVDLVKHFKDTWLHHVKSLDKYSGCKAVGIFMIDMMLDTVLTMREHVDDSLLFDGFYYGDVWREPRTWPYYRLSFDKDLLEWVHGFRNKVKYVMFLAPFLRSKQPGFVFSHNVMGCDVICVENIPALLALNPCGYDVHDHNNVLISCTAVAIG